MSQNLQAIAEALVAKGRGILAADETPRTLTRRFQAHGLTCTAESRRSYREMLFTAPGLAEFISGVILEDETIRQSAATGVPLAQVLAAQGIVLGVKVDAGARPFAGSPTETVTEGLDGLRGRLEAYRALGARFAKWRAVIHIGEGLPSRACVLANAHALARYAALCQEQHLVPIVQPEVLMDGPHSAQRCEEVTALVLHAVFDALIEADVVLEALLLEPNMVTAGSEAPVRGSVEEVAAATLRTLRRRDLFHRTAHRGLGPRRDHVGLEQQGLEHHVRLDQGVEHGVQDEGGDLLAALGAVRPVHQHLRLDDRDQMLFLAEGRAAGERVGVGEDAGPARPAFAASD